jgi:hypothetical protein
MCIILLEQILQNCCWTGLDAWADILYTPDDSSVILDTFNQCRCMCDVFCGIHNNALIVEIQVYANK